ncbi:vWA domain-containing protein [Actinacidiphila rubida]|uniref:Uncharacterized conserved protein YegL, contains vWA domain of TerY type n=1 Tax=Actinacidiphila rubida TaxID=310780 RepID=A0A1H8GIR4_9ACTN|nr:hypothetical protein [Actinacidiphila rubida]SEN43853.1 Uncharacterized conserved protein YegL, contains vWA domain of TerY type [Actinacidiphila rubida]
MSDNRGSLLPVYVLADESGSMTPHLGELNKGLQSLYETMLTEPMAAAKVRLTVLGFADDVATYTELADLRSEYKPPELSTRGSTSYAAAFTAVLNRLPHDIGRLKAEGYRVHRPAVFLLSDGMPNAGQDWRTPHRQLCDRATTPAAPNIVACGIGGASPEVMLEVASTAEFALVSKPAADLGKAISSFFVALTKSMVESGRSLAAGNAELIVTKPEGFSMAIDEV